MAAWVCGQGAKPGGDVEFAGGWCALCLCGSRLVEKAKLRLGRRNEER